MKGVEANVWEAEFPPRTWLNAVFLNIEAAWSGTKVIAFGRESQESRFR